MAPLATCRRIYHAAVPARIAFPFEAPRLWALPDALAVRAGRVPMHCLVCGRASVAEIRAANLRESCRCIRCGASNRQRQVAAVILAAGRAPRPRSLAQFASATPASIYNTEAGGALHRALSTASHYRCSEYVSPDTRGGAVVDGVEHQDLCSLSFPGAAFDLVISGDVLEHVPDPYAAHREIRRVLRDGGRHVFTVPFDHRECLDQTRARRRADGTVEHLLEPQYHEDPVHPEGALVYTIFGLEMLIHLRRIGYVVRVHHLHRPAHGIFGDNALVFEAVRVSGDGEGRGTRAGSEEPAAIGSAR
jgi:SAM-dependent methyltransferase